MTKREKLEQKAFDNGVNVYNYYLGEENLKGLYINGNIALNTSIRKSADACCVLAEELGHHHTSTGSILDMKSALNRKQERQARLWAHKEVIGLHGIIDAYKHGCRNQYETAEFLEITEEFLCDCVYYFRDKYGIGTTFDNYYIMFIPNLMVGKIL